MWSSINEHLLRIVAVSLAIVFAISVAMDAATTHVNDPSCGIVYNGLASQQNHGPMHKMRFAKPGGWPWVVSLFHQKRGESPILGCGGSILNKEFVLTASHCLHNKTRSRHGRLYIEAGNHDRKELDIYTKRRAVFREFLHPGYNGYTLENDIALLQLDRPLRFSRRINSICLPQPSDRLENGSAVISTGWGCYKNHTDYSDSLRETQLPILESETFEKIWGPRDGNNSVIYASTGESGYGSRPGDSGSPLVEKRNGRWLQHGIAFSSTCCNSTLRKENFGFWTNTSAYLDWIGETIAGNSRWSFY